VIGAAPLGSGQHPIEVSETADKANAISSGGRGDLDGAQVLQSWRGLVGSMGRVGAAGDNAAMESFFALLQKNVLNRRRWDTAKTCAWRSSPGSNGPTTATDANASSANSPRPSTR